jgi:hypothetical protein
MTNVSPTGAAMDDRPAAIAALTAEYTALREEIGRHQDHRNQLFSIALAIMAALVGFAGAESHAGGRPTNASIIFLLAPLLFVFLGSAYIDRGRRILDVAIYVNTWLRRQMSESLGVDVWLWESFKKKHYDDSRLAPRWIALSFDGLRGMIFVLCGAISLFVYLALPAKLSSSGRLALFVLDVTLLVVLTLFIWLFEETRGLPDSVYGETPEPDATRFARVGKAIRGYVHGPYPKPHELPAAAVFVVPRDDRQEGRGQEGHSAEPGAAGAAASTAGARHEQ